jgi:hypothetical protein
VSALTPPRFESRRRKDLLAELIERGRVWLPEWRRTEGGDFAAAIFEIAARLSAEVTERLDRVPEKAFRGFLDWLGIRGEAGRAGRLPVVFTMAAGAEAIRAEAPVQFQALDVDPPATFETEQSLTIVPGSLASIVGADPANDAIYRPGSGFSVLAAPSAVPTRWRVKTAAPIGATQIQLEPEAGLEDLPTIVHTGSNQHYRVVAVEAGIVTIDPPVGQVETKGDASPPTPTPLAEDDEMRRLTLFAPFDPSERNRQEHALYIGSEAALNIKAPARIGIEGGVGIPLEAQWFFWGKKTPQDAAAWQEIERDKGDGLVLKKRTGQFEVLEIDGKNSRWLRATTAASKELRRTDLSQLKLTVNCSTSSRTCASTDPPSTVAFEAIANTTPVVLGVPFYPLGREPRLFDAFYLASPEAFSKKNAFVEICFQLADGTTEGYSAARLGRADTEPAMLFGVGKDDNLHRLRAETDPAKPFKRIAPVRPPFSENGATTIAAPSSALNPQTHARLATVSRVTNEIGEALVAVTSKLDAWIWLQSAATTGSRWFRAGTVFDASDGPAPAPAPSDLPGVTMMREGNGLRLVGLYKGTAYQASLPAGWETGPVPQWTRVTPRPADGSPPPAESWQQIAPIFSLRERLSGADAAHGWLAADATGLAIYRSGKLVRLPAVGKVATTVSPLGVRLDDGRVLVVVQQWVPAPTVAGSTDPDDLRVVAWAVAGTDAASTRVEQIAFDSGLQVIGSFDFHVSPAPGSDVAVVFCGINGDEEPVVATWRPLSGQDDSPHYIPSLRSDPIDVLHGAPGLTDGAIVTSGPHAEIVVVGFHPERAHAIEVDEEELRQSWLIEGTGVPFSIGDVIAIGAGKDRVAERATTAPAASLGDYLFLHDFPSDVEHNGVLQIFSDDPAQTTELKGKLKKKGTVLELDSNDGILGEQPIAITFGNKFVQTRIARIDPVGNTKVATLDPAVRGSGDATYQYLLAPRERHIEDHPALHVSDLTSEQKAALVGATLRFDDAAPVQRVTRLHPPGTAPEYALLESPWTDPPVGDPIAFVIQNVYDQARVLSEPRSVNPELSWEYWDGTAWWTIKGLVDGTGNFLFSGKVSFCVPSSLQPTDVVGRTSHWIRARLVGGDYGRESVTITSEPVPNTTPPQTKQSIDRSLDDIVAPQVVSVNLYYSVCCAALPDFVLTGDGGAIRDQSNANRTTDAALELFVPLTETIARAGGALPVADPASTASNPATRALYFGFDEEVTGEPISILFLVDSRNHEDAYPLEVDVLRGRQFEPVSLSDDRTRGMSESGVLTVILRTPPQRASLFGALRHWIRVRPNRRSTASNWKPAVRAAYLNATWARASETQSNEVLGSSDGSPTQRVFLARPPVLRDTLKLRVREPINQEDVDTLRATDPDDVLPVLNGRPGPWVLWKEVVDPADSGAEDRVYALDDENGAITFGDGEHGKIPPIGQDVIVAEQYKRGGGAASNAVTAWSQINLITPLQGVESVAAPEGAAGGSDPQDAAAVLRFAPSNLYTRERALTLRDIETLGLQFLPDVAQVRALARGAGVDVVVVMRGSDPRPPRAVQREIVPYLLKMAHPGLAEKGAVVVKPPELVTVRVSLRLAITSIEQSGAIARAVTTRIAELLDPATGGLDHSGWRLGEVIADEDVAAALDGVPDIDTILAIAIAQQQSDGTTAALPSRLGPADLLHLGPNGVEIEFALAESEAIA